EIALHHDSFFGQIGEHGVRHVRVADDVIDVEPPHLVLEHEMLVDRYELEIVRAHCERVRIYDGRSFDHLANDPLVTAMADHGEPPRHGRTKPGRMVEVVVAH